MIKIFLTIVLLLGLPFYSFAQADTSETNRFTGRELDFWIGEWDLLWQNKEGDTLYGKNTVERTMGGHVIHEQFEQLSGEYAGYRGQSWTVARKGPAGVRVQQTWTDNNGAYGLWEMTEAGEELVALESEAEGPRGKYYQRMEFFDFQPGAFQWRTGWSTDRQHWNWSWQIQYIRKREAEEKPGNEILEVTRAMEQAFAKKDYAAIAGFYTRDATMIGPRATVTGQDSLRTYWAKFDGGKDWSLENLMIRPLSDDYVLQVGISRMTYYKTDQRIGEVASKFSLVWRRTEDGWRILHDFFFPLNED